MNIDRHNYEEFFLLYVDNELSATERNAVELFVQQNPDLGKELHLLQQSIMQHDEIIFDDKRSLLKDGSLALQEKLMLFADDELAPEEKAGMFSLLATDSAAAAEWKILQKTKLQADESLLFEDKASLYRTEGGRVIGIKWWRVAAAAVLLGFGIWLGTTLFKSNKKVGGTEIEPIAKGKTNQPAQNTNPVIPGPVQPTVKEDPNNQAVNSTAPEPIKDQNLPEKNNLVKSNEENNVVKDKLIKQNDAKLKDNNNVVKEDLPNRKPSNNLPKSYLENLNKEASNKDAVVIVQPKTTDNINGIQRPAENKTDVVVGNKEKQIEAAKKINDVNEGLTTNSLAKNALYNEDESKSDTRILYMDEDKVKRTKIGGFLRKIKRVVERTTNIKTGNSVKVAGFEIALK